MRYERECPKCNGDTTVVDSRYIDGIIRRRRRCNYCKHTYNTVEISKDTYDKLICAKDILDKIDRGSNYMRFVDVDALIDKVKKLRDAHETMHLSFDLLYRVLNEADTVYDTEKVLFEVDKILKEEEIPECVILDVAAAIYNGGAEKGVE